MARNEIFISATPRRVYDLLSDSRTYAHWIVGTREVRSTDERWPQVGSVFENAVGIDGLGLRGTTRVTAALPPVLLELAIHLSPLPTLEVRIELQPEGDGTRVTLHERPAKPVLSLLSGPLLHGAVAIRNAESLRRLKEMAEDLTPTPGGPLPRRGSTRAARPPVRARAARG